jgi:hypothetical protein
LLIVKSFSRLSIDETIGAAISFSNSCLFALIRAAKVFLSLGFADPGITEKKPIPAFAGPIAIC